METVTPVPRLTRQPWPLRPYLPGEGRPTPYLRAVPVASDADWGRDPAYLEGLELLVAGYPWEAHERLEAVWRAWPACPLRRHTQALIHTAAAEVHLRLHRFDAAGGQARKALARWAEDAPTPGRWLGLCEPLRWSAALLEVVGGARVLHLPSVPPPLQVVGAAAFREGRLLVMRRAAGRSEGGRWEFPGGKVEPHESEPEALQRELKEELDWDAAVDRPVSATGVDRPGGGMRLSLWRVRAPSIRPTLRDHDAARWLRRDEVLGVDWVPADRPLAQRVVSDWAQLAAT